MTLLKEALAKEKGWKLLVRLFKEAKRDGEISFDEERILRATDLNVLHLVEYIQQAWDDQHLSEEEKRKITFLIKKIRDDATSLAEYDEIISHEEDAMLNIIREIIQEALEDSYYYR